jgi:hypothetical protein
MWAGNHRNRLNRKFPTHFLKFLRISGFILLLAISSLYFPWSYHVAILISSSCYAADRRKKISFVSSFDEAITANEEVGNFLALSHRIPPGIPLFLNFSALFLSHHFTQQKTEISRISVGNFRYMSFFQVLSPPISNVLRHHLLWEVGGKFPSNFLCSLSHLLTKIS